MNETLLKTIPKEDKVTSLKQVRTLPIKARPYMIKKGESRNPLGYGIVPETERKIRREIRRAVKDIVQQKKQETFEYLARKAPIIAKRIVKLSKNAEEARVRLDAAQDVLDRLGIKSLEPGTVIPIQVNVGELRKKFE